MKVEKFKPSKKIADAPSRSELLSAAHAKLMAIRRYVNQVVLEREAETDSALLSILSGASCFFLGDAGAAKSMQIRLICQLTNLTLFEIGMSETTKPEQVFGPVNVPALAAGRQVIKIEGYAPTAEVMFLDEVFKASDVVLNPLLMILNENTFLNGDDGMIQCPTITSFGASNEIPTDKSSRPIYDRFLIRHEVRYIQDYGNLNKFFHLINNDMEVMKPKPMRRDEIHLLRAAVKDVKFPVEIFQTMVTIRDAVAQAVGVVISDRRLGRCVRVVKANALLHRRGHVELQDLDVLMNMFWDSAEQIRRVKAIVLAHTSALNGDLLSYTETGESVFAEAIKNPISIPDAIDKFEKLMKITGAFKSQNGVQVHRGLSGLHQRLSALLKSRKKIKVIKMTDEGGYPFLKLSAASEQVWSPKELRSVGFKHYRALNYFWMDISAKGAEEQAKKACKKTLGAKLIIHQLEGTE